MAASASKKCGGHGISSSFDLAAVTPYAAAVSAALFSAALRFRPELVVRGDAARPLRLRPLEDDPTSCCEESMGGYD